MVKSLLRGNLQEYCQCFIIKGICLEKKVCIISLELVILHKVCLYGVSV